MAIDSAEKRKAVSGIGFGAPGITPNASADKEWRYQAGNSWYFPDNTTTYSVSDDPINLPADPGCVSIDSPLPTGVARNFHDHLVLVNQSGEVLVNQDGTPLEGVIIRDIRTNVIDLGA